VQWIVLTVLVAGLVAGAVWLDRDRHAPVAGYGPIPQPGATLATPGSSLAIGEPAPNFRLLDTEGNVVELSRRRGRPVLIHFWTTWCLDCAVDLPVLQDLSGHYGDYLQVLGIGVGEPAGRVEAAAGRHGANYTMLLDRDGSVAAAYGVTAYPVTVVIDAGGVVRAIHEGPVDIGGLQGQIEALGAGQ